MAGEEGNGYRAQDETNTGTQISHIRYIDNKFQYKSAENGEWMDFNSTQHLEFYYRGQTDISDEVTISVVDWWDTNSPKSITYQVMDYNTKQVFGDKTYTTHYNAEHSGTTLWVTPDRDSVYEIVAVTIGDELAEDEWNNVYDKDKPESGISVSLKETTSTTVYIYVQPKMGNLTIEYRDIDDTDVLIAKAELMAKMGTSFGDILVQVDGVDKLDQNAAL